MRGRLGITSSRLLVLSAQDEDLTNALREVLRDQPCPDHNSFFRLRSAGVLSGETAREARPRCQLYTYVSHETSVVVIANDTAMAQNEFYKVGGTVSSGSPSYVIRQADRDLLQALKAGNFCYVLDSRQIGKSSLMVNTAARLREEGLAVVVLDLTGVGQTLSADQWYAGLLNQVATELQRAGLDLDDEIDDFWLAHGKVGPLQRWFDALREIVLMRWPGQLVFFIDEIDAVRSLAFSSDEFFAGIRECYNRRARDDELNRLTFCLLGVAAPSDLIRDERTTPFNIGQR